MIQDSGILKKNLGDVNSDKGKIREFTDLNTWKEDHKLVLIVYKITTLFPPKETFSLVDQMRRAATSVTSNIAEGFGRQTYREKVQFYYQSQGSLTELKNQVLIAKDVGYLTEDAFNSLLQHIAMTHQLLQGLIKKSKLFVSHKS